ncbi:hypothetical protein SEUCBS140593_007694 [Sporothrix eucalyptigena]|uniref:Dipeptidylpeptidase IV N-terminal domain-containing protein n=1 Tax=Sporothrix eucalyptigena TaxID=1812306 RepID=A0ABP0CFL7_9PEZI
MIEISETAEAESTWTYTSSIWVADVGKAHSARRITDGTFDDRSPKWSNNGKYIVFVSNRHPPHDKSGLYRYWFGVDEQPVPFLTSRNITQFAFPRGQFLVYVLPNGTSSWKQQFFDPLSLEEVGRPRLKAYGKGTVTAIAARAVTSRRWGSPVSPAESHDRGADFLTRSEWPPYESLIWLGGDRRYQRKIIVDTRPEEEPFPFAVVDLAWAGKTLYILAGGEEPINPTIHRLDYLAGFCYSCTEVYGAGDDDDLVVGITGLRDDLVVHTRNEAGDTLRLLLADCTIWQQKDVIHEAVAIKAKRRVSTESKEYHRVLIVAIVSADGHVYTARVEDKVADKAADNVADIESSATSASTGSGVPARRVQITKDSTDDADNTPAEVLAEQIAVLNISSSVPRTEGGPGDGS